MTLLPPFRAYAGSRNPRMLLVGEAWGEGEAELRQPFVGESGKELFLLLGEAMPDVEPELHAQIVEEFKWGHAWTKRRREWLEAARIGLTNVLAMRPLVGNDLKSLCVPKTGLPDKGRGYRHPAISPGHYLLPEYLPELDRLGVEIAETGPNLLVALGNTACWGLLGQTNIGQIRGAIASGPGGRKVLPTYHPAGVLRQWAWRPIVLTDLMKASRESKFPEIRRPDRQILVNPTLEELHAWTNETLANQPTYLAPDIETARGQITCIGFARSRSEAIVVPFVDQARPGWSYWPDQMAEESAWACVASLLESPIPKIFQNGLYDLQYISKMGIRTMACGEDTMLLHHALFPEMLKGLGFLGSVYTSEPSWKLMRKRKADTEKKDE